MRIISKHRDYYDSARAFGEDPTLVYLRHERTVEAPASMLDALGTLAAQIPTYVRGDEHSIVRYAAILGFCGRLYPVWRVAGEWAMTPEQFTGVLQAHVDRWTYYRATDCMRKAFLGEDEPARKSWLNRRTGFTDLTDTALLTEATMIECRERFAAMPPRPELFAGLGLPVFLYEHTPKAKEQVTANPILTRLGFASVLDPWTAYQELAMFVGGVLPRGTEPPIEITDDAVIRDAKGHGADSFKTTSPGKKARRRQRGVQ